MGALANYPLALAPGMGLNAYFTYTVVKGMGVPWQTALGAVFLSGVIFLLLTFGGIRQKLLAAIPYQLHAAVAGGIGLFIAFIGLRNAGIIVPSPATTVTLGNLHAHDGTAGDLRDRADRGAAGVSRARVDADRRAGTLAAWDLCCARCSGIRSTFNPMAMRDTAFHLDIRGALRMNALEIIFVFLFVDLFDNIGTLVAVTERAGLIAEDHTIPRLDRIFFADASFDRRRLAGWDFDGDQLHRECGRRRGGRTHRCHGDRHRPAVSAGDFRRAGGWRDSGLSRRRRR